MNQKILSRKLAVFFLFYIMLNTAFSQVIHRVYLTANTTEIKKNTEYYNQFKDLLSSEPEPFTLIINGDLIKGRHSKKNSSSDSIRIKTMLESVAGLKQGDIIIIPGDRDWADSGEKGLKTVRGLEKLVKSFEFENVKWAIKKGCPGPKVFELNEHILLVTVNTQWWNHPYDKPGPAGADCKISTTSDFKEELEDIIDENTDKNILIAGHFPVFSLGEYGGYQSFRKHLFPLTDLNKNLYLPIPILGSLYPSYRQNIGNSKDIINENYENIRKDLEDIITHRHSLMYLSGHEKNLQIIKKEDNYFINSGSPQTSKYASTDSDALLSESLPGIIEIVYYDNGKIVAQAYEYTEKHGFKKYRDYTLYQSPLDKKENNLPVNMNYIHKKKKLQISTKMSGKYETPATVIAGKEYEAGGIKRLFLGDHYRDTWTKEITVPYLNLDTTFGGLTPYKKGGGRQTKSLKFKAGNGLRYTFRSVNKDPVKALDYDLRETGAADIIRDQTTTQHPFGAMAADIMLNELDILHAHPKLYVLPKDDKLGSFKEDYGNMLGMLEEDPKNPKENEKTFANADEIVRSHKLFRKLYEDHDNRIDTHVFARARIFDILVGDWGKHEDNWKWAGYNQGNGKIFKPIPRDRDHVFSRWDGILPWLADREWAKESGEDFDYEIDGLRSLVFQARHLDRYVTSELSKKDWQAAAGYVKNKITDQVIEKAVRNMPAEIYNISGKIIEDKLKSRIKDLEQYALEYYEMLAEEADVVGSNKREYFEVIRNSDGTVDVSMYNLEEKKKPEKGKKLLYFRKFYPDETDEIRLFGLGGKDVFEIKGETDESIKVKLIGGPGADSIHDLSLVSGMGSYTLVYEKSKKGEMELGNEATIINVSNEAAYNYDRTTFAYDTYFPLPYIAYNADDGFVFSPGVQFVFHANDKEDYSSKHNVRATVSTSGTIKLQYSGRFHHVLKKWDVEFSGLYAQPNDFINFFGIGNETVNKEKLYTSDFYKTRYISKQLSAGLIRDFWKYSSLNVSVHYENNEAQIDKQKTLFNNQSFFGSDKINLIEGIVSLDLDFRDNASLPEKGMRLKVRHNNGIISNNKNSNYGQTIAFIEYYSTLSPLTLALKAGSGDSYGEIPFYREFSLGQNNNLRGFHSDRFTGESILFMNSELRLQLLQTHTTLIPMKFGVKGFFDVGKIIESSEDSDIWHQGYGFGIYMVPYSESFTLTASVGFSKEESALIQIGLGSTF